MSEREELVKGLFDELDSIAGYYESEPDEPPFKMIGAVRSWVTAADLAWDKNEFLKRLREEANKLLAGYETNEDMISVHTTIEEWANIEK